MLGPVGLAFLPSPLSLFNADLERMGIVVECSFFAWKRFIDSHSGSLALGVSPSDAVNYRL